MSDTTQILQLPKAQLASIERDGDTFTLHFSQVHVIQEMEGAFEDSLWSQAVDLTIRGATLEGTLPDCPCVIGSGDLTDNIYTYRDHTPLPVKWRGEVACQLIVDNPDTGFLLRGTGMDVKQLDYPRYIKHIKKGWQEA